MKETKEDKRSKKEKQKEKATIGDILFRILIIGAMFLIAVIMYAFYLRGIG